MMGVFPPRTDHAETGGGNGPFRERAGFAGYTGLIGVFPGEMPDSGCSAVN